MSAQPPILRILDANLNRAREGLRVVEEFARFILEDAHLAQAFKQLRHDLVAAVSPEIAPALSAHRDSAGDVGRGITTSSEGRRGEALDVAWASAARVGEALRTVEEYAKTCDPALAERFAALRYRMYDLDRRLRTIVAARSRFAAVRIYVLMTEKFCRGDWYEIAASAINGGADAIQLREKNLSDAELLDRARRLATLCRARNVLFLVNDRPDIALLSHASGVHLGQEDLPVRDLRRILPASMIVGVSTHTREQIDRAVADAPDYIAVGPMFPSATKPQEHIAGPHTLAYARGATALPLVAIGGITPENADLVLEAAPCTLAVCSAITAAPDPQAATQQLRAICERACRNLTMK